MLSRAKSGSAVEQGQEQGQGQPIPVILAEAAVEEEAAI